MVRPAWHGGWSLQLVALFIPLVSLQLLPGAARSARQHYGSPQSLHVALAWVVYPVLCMYAVQPVHAQQGSLPPLPPKPSRPPPLPPKPSRRGKPPVPPKPPEYDETAATAAELKLQTQQDEAERLAMEQQRYNEELAEQSIIDYGTEQRISAQDTEEQAAVREALAQEAEEAAQDELAEQAMRAEEERVLAEAEAAQRHFAAQKAADKQRSIDEEEAYFKAHGMHGYEL
jgi:hypothetical protein